MTALEIIMLAIGIVCFIWSFVLTNDDAQPMTKRKPNYKPELTKEQIDQLTEQVEGIVANQVGMVEESTEAALDKISNTKIMEMNEYAESVFNEINKNHNETVFMYDMLNDKAKEIKNLVKEVNNAKTQMEASGVTMQEYAEYLEKLMQQSEKTIREIDIAIKAAYKTRAAMAQEQEERDKPVLNNVITPQFFEQRPDDNSTAATEELPYMAKAEPDVTSNCNEQILLMHKQGKSNLEIAKTLNLGMGEVKLVIDLFNKNR